MVLSFPDGCTLAGSLSFIWYLSHGIKVLLIPSLWSLVTSVHHNLGYGPVIAVPVIRLIVYLLKSHAFPFQGLPWKGWVFRSASSCPLRLLGPGHGIRSFGCHPSRKFFLRVEFIATLFPATVQMLAFSGQSKEEDSQSFHLILARLQVMVLRGNAATDASTFLKILGSLTL